MGRQLQTETAPGADLRAPALERGLDILEFVHRRGGLAGFGEIQRGLAIPPSTAVRLLEVLVAKGFLGQTPEGKYRLGEAIQALARPASSTDALKRAAVDLVPALSEAAHGTVLLLGWDGQTIECLAKHLAPESVTMQPVGTLTTDLATRPWGQMIHALLAVDEQQRLEARSAQPDRLRQLAPATRVLLLQQGYLADTIGDPGIVRWTAPVYRGDALWGAIGLGAIANPDDVETLQRRGRLVADTAAMLSRRLG
jgi:DNA-binding IclR family transcriptional regulator